MNKIKIGFIERKPNYFVSIEKVFRLVEKGLDQAVFSTSFQQLPFLNNLSGIVRNLRSFKPDESADVYHVTGHSHYIALNLPPEKTILTVHDTGFLHTSTGLRRWVLKKLLLDLPLRRLKYVTSVSQATKDEIEANVAGIGGRVRVIENPLDDLFRASEKAPFNVNTPNILQIGASPNKNLDNLIRAVAGLSCRLTIIGDLDERAKVLLQEVGVSYTNKSQLEAEDLKAEYTAADIVSFCSLHEGFGLPIIEAQAMQTPVITSDLSPMREVAGENGAILVDPYDHASIRKGLLELIEDESLRTRLVTNGLRNIERYDKSAIAAKYAALYMEIIRTSK